ncbi:g8246 [Coccomyxa elongata]
MGATVHLTVGPVNDGGLRGTVATKDLASGDLVLQIPNSATIDVGDYTLPGAELAVALFRRQLSDPKWNASFEPYWKSLPEVGTLMSKEVWDNAEHRALLQNDYMASYAEVNANWTRDVWGGNATLEPHQMFPQLLKENLPGADKITYEEFKHVASLTATYSFVFPDQKNEYKRVLLPLFDLINHKGEGANTYVGKDATTGSYHLITTKNIKKGEEISHCYNWDNERNDYSLINYFFIQTLIPPRLCALDLPNGSLDGGFVEPDDRYLPHEKGAIQELIAQFQARLKKFPTTEGEDEKILADKGSKLDWVSRRIIDFRRERKRTLRLTIERLKEREKTAYSLPAPAIKAGIAKEEL